MFFDDKLKLSVDILKSRVDDLSNDKREWWDNLRSVRSKVNALYKTDKHGAERPKVDILDDDVFRDIRSMETDIYELQEKVEKLEKKK